MDVLSEIISDTRLRVAERRDAAVQDGGPEAADVGHHLRPQTHRFRDALAMPGMSVIAEHKRSSPSAGMIRADLPIEAVVRAYEAGGAAALSILTEESRFGGSLADIAAARRLTSLPILRKDFIVDAFQLIEAADVGADAVLLIVAAFPGEVDTLARLQQTAADLGLDVLMEVHDDRELDIALRLEAGIIGINNRNLATLQVDLATTFALLPQIPPRTVSVAESGFRTADEVAALSAAGVDAVLVGEALMRAPDPELACRTLSGRAPTMSS